MLTNQRVEDIDQLLNELEREAQSNVPSSRFFAHLLQRVRLLLECDSVSILAPTGSSWLCLAQQGAADPSAMDAFAKSIATYPVDQQPESVMSAGANRAWYAVPLRTASFAKGCLLVTFATQPPSAAVPGMLELLSAFAEVLALRQVSDLESFLDHRWTKLQTLCSQLLNASPGRDSAAVLVNELVSICGAARVSLATVNRLGTVKLQRVSGTVTLDANAKVVRSLTRLAEHTTSTCKPHLQQNRSAASSTQSGADFHEDGVFANALCVPLVASSDGKRCDSALVIEWTDYDAMISSVASVIHMLPTLSIGWQQHQRWQRIPSALRWLGDRRVVPSRLRARLIVVALLVALGYGAYRVLMMPYPLTVDATGVIEPQVSRTVFATLDGHLRELLVQDGQLVEANQPVARMHSPDIEFRIEEVLGELRTLKEKRNALQVASNQIDANASDAMLNQNRLAAEIKQIETQAAGLNQQLKLLRAEENKATLVAPIRGRVVAKDIEQQLASRPLRRGEALFRIVDFDASWHLKVEVADRDSGYVLAEKSKMPDNALPIRFVLDSLPGEQFNTNVHWISTAIQNRHGEGCYVEMRADVPRDVVDRTHMGASARAYFRCSDQPLWFVWCRPLVEAVQHRWWHWR